MELKLLLLLIMLIPIAVVDWQQRIIPNHLLLIAAGVRLLCYVPEILGSGVCSDGKGTAAEYARAGLACLGSDLLAGLGLGGLFLLLAVISRYRLGLGDVKLFALLGFFLGWQEAGTALLYSFAVSFVLALILLISGKKSRQDSIAFAPCVLAGIAIFAASRLF
ncbi:MAG: prepilin peptidase [Saccharofermentanales bacterium]|jgi:leader peptidase (prepilin peptidase)/N-methyltransferase|nr:prepilin peptidase [Bacillota bacterium]NLB08115.1 hypothetical protein [Clostridiales bacterium]